MRIGIEQWGYREDGDQANEGAVRTGVRQNKVAVMFRNYADEGAVRIGIRRMRMLRETGKDKMRTL